MSERELLPRTTGMALKTILMTTIAAGSLLAPANSGMFSPEVAQAASLGTYTVTADVLNVRSGAGVNFQKIGSLKIGARVTAIQKLNNGWYKINFSGKTGYVSGAYIKQGTSPTASAITYVVNATTLNVRSGAGTNYKKIGSLKNGAKVDVIQKQSNGWYRINYNGKTGYVSGQYVKVKNSATTPPPVSTSAIYLVTGDSLNVRSGAGASYQRIGSVSQGTKLSVVRKESNGWYRIHYKGKTGFVDGRYVHKGDTSSKRLNVPLIKQRPELPSGCEVTSLTMALRYHGTKVDKMTLAKKLPYDQTKLVRNSNGSIKIWGDPDVGFVGDPKGNGYTINPKPLKRLLDQYRSGGIDLTGKNFSEVERYVKQGKPVLTWFTINYGMPKDRYWKTPAGKRIYAPTPLHCVVVTGFDTNYVYFNDPENSGGKDIKMSKGKFINIFNAMGNKALVVR